MTATPVAPIPAAAVVAATVTGSDGATFGAVRELMIDPASGAVVYAAVAVGGMLGVGERLFALPWAALQHGADGKLSVAVASTALDGQPGFDKDAWPATSDAVFDPAPKR